MMTAMSVFNSGVSEQSNPVFNLDWSGYARGSDVEKAAGKVAGSVEKGVDKASSTIAKATETMTCKLSGDIKQNAEKITAAVKDGTKDVVDSVKRITTNANQNPPTIAVDVSAGLASISESTAKLANHLRSNPTEMSTVAESAEAVGKQFNDLIVSTKEFAKGRERLKKTTAEVAQSTGWISSNYPNGCVSVNNSSGLVPDMSVFNFR